MGISDDIKPKKAAAPAPEPVIEEEVAAVPKAEDREEIEAEDDRVEIPIDKHGANQPVYEDLLPKTPKQFEHVEEERPRIEETLAPNQVFAPEIKHEEEKPIAKEDSFQSFAHFHDRQPRKSHLLTIIIVLFVILLAALLVLQNYDQIRELLGGTPAKETTEQPISSGVEIIGSDDFKTEPSSESTENSDSEVTAPPVATPTETAPPAITTPAVTPPAEVNIRVLNGNGITGSAAAVKDILVAEGYNIPAVSNASRFTYTKTMIYYNTDKKAEADAVATILSSRTTEVVLNPTVAGASDIVVVVGKS